MDMTKITFCTGTFITSDDCKNKHNCERFIGLNIDDKTQKTFAGIFPNEDFSCNYYWKIGNRECYAGNQTC